MNGLNDALGRAFMLLVRGYRYWLKPWLGSACRFEPTCSAYALQALQAHGPWRGLRLTGWRILRCHPWCDGGCDPVPGTMQATDQAPHAPDSASNSGPAPGLFTGLMPESASPPHQLGAPPNRNSI